jgi:hypothetical protein
MGANSNGGVSRGGWRKQLCYVLCAAAALAAVGVVCFPEVVSAAWHLTHGKSVRFHQLQVPVPWGWWAFQRDEMLLIQKTERISSRRGDSLVIVSPSSFPSNYGTVYEKARSAMAEIQFKQGYRFVSEYRIQVQGHEGHCLSFESDQNKQPLRIICDIPDLSVFFEFQGEGIYASVFQQIMQTATISAAYGSASLRSDSVQFDLDVH